MKLPTAFLLLIAMCVPTSVSAASTIISVIDTFKGYFNALIPLFMTLGIVYFMWGLVKLIYNAEDERARAEGKQMMIWGMIGLFVMVAFWGIIGYVQSSFGIGTVGATGTGPEFPNYIP